MSVELKIKAKHLAAEVKIIKHEEVKELKRAKAQRDYLIASGMKNDFNEVDYKAYSKYRSIYLHRKNVVRPEARATHLARAFINGRPYKTVERSVKEQYALSVIVEKIMLMVNKYGREWDTETRTWPPLFTKDDIKAWLEAE